MNKFKFWDTLNLVHIFERIFKEEKKVFLEFDEIKLASGDGLNFKPCLQKTEKKETNNLIKKKKVFLKL